MVWEEHTEAVIIGPAWVWNLDTEAGYNMSARISMNEYDTFDVVVEMFRKHERIDSASTNGVASLFDARVKRGEIVNKFKTRAIKHELTG